MGKHTIGPWRIDSRTVIGLKAKQICEVPGRGIIQGKVDIANARLIAAAPELLFALNNLMNACYKADLHEELSEIVDGNLFDAAEAAIAKATGEGV